MKVVNHAGLPSEQLASIESEIAGHRTLEQVLKWGLAQPADQVIPHVIADVVIQDEYSHDVIVPWRDGLILVYGTT